MLNESAQALISLHCDQVWCKKPAASWLSVSAAHGQAHQLSPHVHHHVRPQRMKSPVRRLQGRMSRYQDQFVTASRGSSQEGISVRGLIAPSEEITISLLLHHLLKIEKLTHHLILGVSVVSLPLRVFWDLLSLSLSSSRFVVYHLTKIYVFGLEVPGIILPDVGAQPKFCWA